MADQEKVAGEIRPKDDAPSVKEAVKIAKNGGKVIHSGDSGTTGIKYPSKPKEPPADTS